MMRMSRRKVLLSSGAALAGSAFGILDTANAQTSGTVRLEHNENPFGPSLRAQEALLSLGDGTWKYAYEEVPALRKLIAEHEGVLPENIFVGAGSGEILKLAAVIYGEPGREIIAARPTFDMLPWYAARRGASVTWVDLNRNLGHDFAAMGARVSEKTSLVYVCNPNNPTGTLSNPDDLREFIQAFASQALIVVDEAYIDFSSEPEKLSAIDRVKAGENILVTRTFSKIYGLAGLRIGYGVANVDVIRKLESLRISIPNQAGVAAARASHGDARFCMETRVKIASSMEVATNVFKELDLRFVPSQTNFMMFDTTSHSSKFVQFARDRGVSIAPVDEPYSNWARVAMGRPKDMGAFADALRAFVNRS